MTKGLSAIIATIMLLMITVALIGVFYVFGTSLMSSSTSATTESTTKTTEMMMKTIALSFTKCTNTTPTNNVINFTVQNLGTRDILAGDLKVFVDDVLNADESPDLAVTGLASTQQIQAGVQTTSYKKTRSLRVQGPSNTESRTLTC